VFTNSTTCTAGLRTTNTNTKTNTLMTYPSDRSLSPVSVVHIIWNCSQAAFRCVLARSPCPGMTVVFSRKANSPPTSVLNLRSSPINTGSSGESMIFMLTSVHFSNMQLPPIILVILFLSECPPIAWAYTQLVDVPAAFMADANVHGIFTTRLPTITITRLPHLL